jgi:hypothetical protein
LRARARGAGEIDERREHVGNDKQGRVLGHRRAPIGGDDGEPGAGRKRRSDEVVAVAALPFDGEECLAAPDRTAVDRDSGHVCRQRARPRRAHRDCHGVEGPQGVAHATFSSSAAATAP